MEIIFAANVICGEATWSLLIKTAFGRFNQQIKHAIIIMYSIPFSNYDQRCLRDIALINS